jgi:hypothetical protein
VKGITTLISFIILVAITFTIAAMMNPWLFRTITNEGDDLNDESNQFVCRNVQYAFIMAYGTEGMDFSLCTEPRYVRAKIKNYGSVDLYGFSFLLVFNDSEITIPVTQESQSTESDPLRPQEERLIEGIPEECISDPPNEIRITNGLGCSPLVYSM